MGSKLFKGLPKYRLEQFLLTLVIVVQHGLVNFCLIRNLLHTGSCHTFLLEDAYGCL